MAPESKTADPPTTFWWHSIGRRFIVFIFLFSSLVTLLSTAVQLYFEYRRDLENIEAHIGQIQKSHLKGLSEGLWSFNDRIIRVQLQGILDLPDMRYLEIRKQGEPFLTAGEPVAGQAIRHEFPLAYLHRAKEVELGTLLVVVGMDGVYARLLDRVVIILLTQGVKTFFVSTFIFILFYFMVGRHLQTMAAYAGSLSLNQLCKPLAMSRSGRYADKDEIGRVVAAVNGMRQTLLQDLQINRRAEKTMQMLAESAAGLSGQELFDAIVRNLCEYLGCEGALLGRLKEEDTVVVIAMVVDGKAVAEHPCELKGTPFENIGEKGYRVFPERVSSLFPNDRDLAALGAEGYAGIPIVGRSGNPLGILCGFSRARLEPPAKAEEIMRILQARAAAEMERMQAEQEREGMSLLLRQAQKMEAIGTLAGGIAHDFNNILTPIIGFTQLAHRHMTEAESKLWNVDEVLQAAQRAKGLVQQILTFSRQREQERAVLQLQPLIKETIKLLRASLPSTIEIRLNIEPDCGAVLADPTQMQQVFMNLCTNAFQAMAETGGVLEVMLREVSINGQQPFTHERLPSGRYLCLTVGDTGNGMDKATMERIFEPYFTTKPQGKGTGLGLALVHGIVKGNKGRIDVYSEVGQGSVFKVYLPLAGGYGKEAAPNAEREEPLPLGKERILVVDDEEQVVRTTSRMLEHLGYFITGVTDSREGLRLFEENPHGFDLVISDQTMPNLTGGELARQLMKIRPGMPIIICTGFSEQLTEERAMTMGIRGYLMKPLNLHELACRVRNVLDSRNEGEETA